VTGAGAGCGVLLFWTVPGGAPGKGTAP